LPRFRQRSRTQAEEQFTEFRKAVQSAGYVGRILLELTITETGVAQNPKITTPARLNSDRARIDQVRSWRFCPAVIFNRYKAGKAHSISRLPPKSDGLKDFHGRPYA
jgi:hypothetical protein